MLAIPVDQARVWASPDHTTERPVGGVMSGGGIDESDRPAPAETPQRSAEFLRAESLLSLTVIFWVR